eukprot:6405951-Amphidinium_carterae.1
MTANHLQSASARTSNTFQGAPHAYCARPPLGVAVEGMRHIALSFPLQRPCAIRRAACTARRQNNPMRRRGIP